MRPDIFVNKKVWQAYTPGQLQEYQEKVFDHYRERGFPYFVLTKEQRQKIFARLTDFDTDTLVVGENELNQTMLGLNLCNYHFPNIWEAKARSFKSPLETFCDDESFRIAIRKRVQHGDNMSDAGIRKVLSYSHGSQRVSNFRPTIAKYIYNTFAPGGDVLDFSSGYGGRLFGFLASNARSYTGCEPNTTTYTYLKEVAGEYAPSTKSVALHHSPFEDFSTDKTFDLIFSSPPYFDTERYCDEPTQSYLRYPTRDSWRDGFLRPLISKSFQYLKPQGALVINVANVVSYPTLEEEVQSLCRDAGLSPLPTLNMRLSKLMGAGFKHEPIFCYSKGAS